MFEGKGELLAKYNFPCGEGISEAEYDVVRRLYTKKDNIPLYDTLIKIRNIFPSLIVYPEQLLLSENTTIHSVYKSVHEDNSLYRAFDKGLIISNRLQKTFDGLLEEENNNVYDSAVVLDPDSNNEMFFNNIFVSVMLRVYSGMFLFYSEDDAKRFLCSSLNSQLETILQSYGERNW